MSSHATLATHTPAELAENETILDGSLLNLHNAKFIITVANLLQKTFMRKGLQFTESLLQTKPLVILIAAGAETLPNLSALRECSHVVSSGPVMLEHKLSVGCGPVFFSRHGADCTTSGQFCYIGEFIVFSNEIADVTFYKSIACARSSAG